MPIQLERGDNYIWALMTTVTSLRRPTIDHSAISAIEGAGVMTGYAMAILLLVLLVLTACADEGPRFNRPAAATQKGD